MHDRSHRIRARRSGETPPSYRCSKKNIYLPYASFSTGAGGGSLVDVKVNLRPWVSMVNPTTVGLYSDNSTSPGSLLAAIGTVDVQALVDPGSNLLDFPLTTPFALTANTRYWIGLSSPGTSTPSWNYSQSASGIGVSGEYIHVGSLSQTVPTSTAAYLMSVEVAPVPEIDPAGLGSVMALVTGVVGLVERRRRPVA